MTTQKFNRIFPTKRKGKTHKSTSELQPPKTEPDAYIDRDKWFDQVIRGFVSTSRTNRGYYEIILKTMWPEGHGIPGPHVDQKQIREALDAFRGKPYVDTFRRVRELQGEEGIQGLIKHGTVYQLVDLSIAPKRHPRTSLGKAAWTQVLKKYGFKCAACQAAPDENGFQQDHKIPRAKGGTDAPANWQPLCDECNIMKSTACRNCDRDCNQCCWAFPEKYKPLAIPGDMLWKLRQYAEQHFKQPEELVIEFIKNLGKRKTD